MPSLYDDLLVEPAKFKSFAPRIFSYSLVTSTNEVARGLIDQNAGDGTVVVADSQSQGHGRYDRRWESPLGGLYLSLLLTPRIDVAHAPLLGLLCAVGAAYTVHQISQEDALLKWPNDLLLKGKKIGGILSELVIGQEPLAIIGVGVNINIVLHDLPPTVRENSTSLAHETGRKFSLSEVLLALLENVDKLLARVEASNSFDSVLAEWRRLSATLGRQVVVTGQFREVEGYALDIDELGRLIVQQSDESEVIVSIGDVEHLSM
ncbi:MAG: biotin--[acetyl-CoA-carboxylase] ligase [Candidatus Thorarchaeota archaeon]|nr:biotin--[acetyl-CoA-carboxylase] ligase [Candidatus Thorarchaeota archaeon]